MIGYSVAVSWWTIDEDLTPVHELVTETFSGGWLDVAGVHYRIGGAQLRRGRGVRVELVRQTRNGRDMAAGRRWVSLDELRELDEAAAGRVELTWQELGELVDAGELVDVAGGVAHASGTPALW